MSGLRERRRLKAMRAIQDCALDLFDERGFGAVTIEEIAAAAAISPSSVYRYFGTKEGIVVADIEFDGMSAETLEAFVDPDDLVASMLRTVGAYDVAHPGHTGDGPPAVTGPWRRIRYFFGEPSVRLAVLGTLDRAGQRVAPLIAARAGVEETQARVIATALAFGYFAALEQWYLNGGGRPIAEYVEDGMRPLRGIWPVPG
ncbi:TetR/AcrR family transcriptional regulator [Nonomuraea sp. NBC_01738]|uniref:TetR/AcrR family transcriptional regulator n=1 Tax=Nonomuraea sp. NBC_01738 TaxID=2976003 RepID=UPI002E1042DA|nr:TetR/AcrR family transcriptional regulator [Nonomuraea sp. NBC_01738]